MHRSICTTAFAATLLFLSCSDVSVSETGGRRSLGSFDIEIMGEHISVTPQRPENKSLAKDDSDQISAAPFAYLGWPESIDVGNPLGYYLYAAIPVACEGGSYNTYTRTLTSFFRFRSLLSMDIPECAEPGSLEYETYCACDPSHGLFPLCGTRIRGPVELKMFTFYPNGVFDETTGENIGPLPRESLIDLNMDYGCFEEGCFWNDPSFPGYDSNDTEYKTLHPGWDGGPASNFENDTPDIALEPGEESECIPSIFRFDDAGGLLSSVFPNHVPGFTVDFDVLGFLEGYGPLPNPPVVGDSPASTARYRIWLDVGLTSPADRVRYSIGTREVICEDNASCDRDPAPQQVRVSVWLDRYQENRIYVHQSNGTTQSPGTLKTVRHHHRWGNSFPRPHRPPIGE